MKEIEKKPSRPLAQSAPNFLYNAFADSGNAGPNADLTRPLPA
jgi:hypothetical protein